MAKINRVNIAITGDSEQVREVMRYAGPRMPLRYPWLALLHLLDKLRAAGAIR